MAQITDHRSQDINAKYVNEKIDIWYKENIENAPVVYVNNPHGYGLPYLRWQNVRDISTHQARLVCIELIKQKECTHHAVLPNEYGCGFVCRDCRKMLRPKGGWEAV